jgi:hypothetical protein
MAILEKVPKASGREKMREENMGNVWEMFSQGKHGQGLEVRTGCMKTRHYNSH